MKKYLMFVFCLVFAVCLVSCGDNGSDSSTSNLTKKPEQITNGDNAEKLSLKDEVFIPGEAGGTESPTIDNPAVGSESVDIVGYFDFGKRGAIRLDKSENSVLFLRVKNLDNGSEKILKVKITSKKQKVGLIDGADLIFTAMTNSIDNIRMIAKAPGDESEKQAVVSFDPNKFWVRFSRDDKSKSGLAVKAYRHQDQ